jgi:lipopolysaccharide heptosyltransferase II
MVSDVHTPYRRILLTRMKFIGDIVLTTSLLRDLRAACPDAFIAFLGEKNAVALLEGNPFLDEIIPFDFSRGPFLEQLRVAFLLRRRKFDLVVDLFGNPRSALLSWISGAKTRVGPDRRGRGRLYTLRVSDDGVRRTAPEFHARTLAAAGIKVKPGKTEIYVTAEEKQSADAFLKENVRPEVDRPLVCLHPGATWPAKRWPAYRFASLADAIVNDLKGKVVIAVGPGDGESVSALVSHARVPVAVLPVLPLRVLAALLSRCTLMVANDAGPMHIAVAVGTPTIGIFGPGEEDIWFPYDSADGHRALRKDVPCHPCHLDFCDRQGEGYMECMNLLSVDEVLHAIKGLLAR